MYYKFYYLLLAFFLSAICLNAQDKTDKELIRYLVENNEIYLTVKLGLGKGSSTAYGCDLTEEYVKINAYYTT